MSAKVAYARPPRPETPKHFATLLIGIVLVIVGAILINQGISAVQAGAGAVTLGVGLLAAGALLVFAGASRVWPGKPMINAALFGIGVVLLAASGSQLVGNWEQAAYAIVLALVGIALIIVGVQVASQSWKRYMAR